MSKARDRRKKSKKKLKRNEEVAAFKSKKYIRNFIIIGVIVVVAITVSLVIARAKSIEKYAHAITKDTAREEIFGYKPEISHPRNLSNPLRIADGFAAEDLEKDGKKIAEEAIIEIENPDVKKPKKVPDNVSMLLVVDNNLKVIALKSFKPTYFMLGVNFNKFFNAFKGKSAEQFIKQIDGIYTDDSNTALLIKNKVREAMSLFYIEKYGAGEYDKIAKGNFVFAERGTNVKPIKAKDINGNEIDLSELKNYKLVLIGGNPNCGGCVSDVNRIGNEIKKYNTTNIKFIVFSFSNNPEDAHRLTDSLPKGVVTIVDGDRAIAKKLKIGISPYISLVDKNLTLYYRGPCEPTRETLLNIKEFLGGE